MSKGKGSDYERYICHLLSKWWSNGKRDDLFWRSAGSGARAKVRSKNGRGTFGQYGDVTATDPEGLKLLEAFTIEMKRGYNAADFTTMLDKPEKAACQMWEVFFQQVCQDHINAESLSWLLIWRRDRRQALIFTETKIVNQLNDMGISFLTVPHFRARIKLKEGGFLRVWTCPLDDFLRVVNPNHIRRLVDG